MDRITASIVQQIENEAAAQHRLSNENIQKYNILRYYTHSPFFGGLDEKGL